MSEAQTLIRKFENACAHAWANDEHVSVSRGRQLHAAVDESRKNLESFIARSELVAAEATAVCRAFLARYNNTMVNADLLFSDIAEMASNALDNVTKGGQL